MNKVGIVVVESEMVGVLHVVEDGGVEGLDGGGHVGDALGAFDHLEEGVFFVLDAVAYLTDEADNRI